jgi:hypothetical protein
VKIADSRAAAWRYGLAQDRYGSDRYPVVPDDYGPVHALLYDPPGTESRRMFPKPWLDNKFHDPVFLRSREEAACGRYVGLVFPVPFDTDEEEACQECLRMAHLWLTDRNEFDRTVGERHAARRTWHMVTQSDSAAYRSRFDRRVQLDRHRV